MSRTQRHAPALRPTRPTQVTNAERFFRSVDGTLMEARVRAANGRRWSA